MGNFAIIAIFVGCLTFLGIYLWIYQRKRLDTAQASHMDELIQDLPIATSNAAVLVATEHGQLLHANYTARGWLGTSDNAPDLEFITRNVQPADSFLNLFVSESQASFQMRDRWVEASSHYIPTERGRRIVVVIRELSKSADTPHVMDFSLAMSIINELGDTVTASMGIEQALQIILEIVNKHLDIDAGEICLLDAKRNVLQQRGWLGDTQYLIKMSKSGGVYQLGQGVPGWVAQNKVPLFITSQQQKVDLEIILEDVPYRGIMAIPLELSDRFVGTLSIYRESAGDFQQPDLALLQAISQPITIAIHNAELYTQQEERINDIASLQQIVEQPKQTEDVAPIYKLLNERIANLLDADMSGVLIYDDNRQSLIPQLPFYGLPDHVVQSISITMPPDSPQRDIWKSQPYWVSNDISDEPLAEALGLKAIIDVAGIENTAIFPLQIGQERIGVIIVSNKRSGGFIPRDLQSLRVLSTQAAIVVENLRLYQREQRIDAELVGLQEMTRTLGALSHAGEFYLQITERIARLMNSEMCGILLYDEKTQSLRSELPFFGVDDALVADYKIDLPDGSIMAELWTDESAWYSNRVFADSLVFAAGLDQIAEATGVEKTLIAAMSVGGKRIGVVQVSNKIDQSDFDENDARLLQIFATQAGAVVENARLFREVQRRADQAERLRKVAEMSSGVITTEQTFTPVLEEIANLTDSDAVYISVLDHAANSLIVYPRWMYGIQQNEPVTLDIRTHNLKHNAALSGEPVLSNHTHHDQQLPESYHNLSTRFGLNSLAVVPLYVGDRPLGELTIANRNHPPYSQDDITALGTIAAQIAAAVERLLLYEATGDNLRRRQEELDAISRVSNELTLTIDLDAILETIRHEATKGTYADSSTVVLLRPSERWRAANKPEMERRVGDTIIMPRLAEIEEEAIIRGADPVLVDDYQTSPLQPAPNTARSGAAAAILYLDQIVGVIHVYHHEPNRFDEQSAAFLMTLSNKASLGYQNALRYQEQIERGARLRQRVDQLNRIFELGQMVHSNAEPVDVLEAIAYSVQQSVGFDTVLMTLVDENKQELRRVTHAGMPLDKFRSTQERTLSLDDLDALLKAEFAISESYLFPVEQLEKWYTPGIKTLSASYEDNRSLEYEGPDFWHDGDMLLVPINGSTGKLIGMMTLDRPYSNKRPDRTTVEVLEIFAHQASSMIENTRLFRESQRSAEQEAQLNSVMKAISSTLDITEIISEVAKGAQQLLPFSQITVAVTDANQDSFDYIKVHVLPDEQLEITQEQRLDLKRTALGHTFTDRVSVIYHADDETTIMQYDDLNSWYAQGERTSLILPLLTGGESLGALHIGSRNDNIQRFMELVPLMERIAQLMAGAIQNAHLFNQAVDLQTLNRSVVESIQQGIVVLDNSGRIININAFMRNYGWTNDAIHQDLFAYRPDLSKDLKDDLQTVLSSGVPREKLGLNSITANGNALVRNFYMYPLRSQDLIRGAVLLVEDVTERTKLEQAIESRANQLAALTEVSTRITASLERDEIISLALEEMGWIIPFDMMSIWRRNGSFMVLEGSSGFIVPNAIGEAVRIRIGDYKLVKQVIESQRVVTVSDDNLLMEQTLPGEQDVRSWMGVPLVNQGHVVGMLVLAKRELNFYETRAEQHVAFAFASQVAIALANADLFEQTFERTNELGTLLEAAQATSLTLDLDEVFRTVAELMFSALEMDDCTIMIWDEVDNYLEVQVDINRTGDTDMVLQQGTQLDLSEHPAKLKALQEREVIVVVDSHNAEIEERYPRELASLHESHFGARMLVPLVVRDRSIGLIQLEQLSNDEETLTQQKVRLARALGSQVAVAIENARLSTETTTRFEELLTINQLSQSISSTLDVNDMLKIIRDQVPNVTGASQMYLALYERDTQTITFPLAVRDGDLFNIAARELGTDEVSYIIKQKHSLSLGADYFSIDDLRRSMGISNGEGEAKSYMGVPLIAGDEVLGVLAIRDTERTRAFNLNDERILTTVGAQLGAAIQNSRLVERISSYAENLEKLVDERTNELEQERDSLETLYQITSELARTLDMEQLLDRALGMVSKAVGAEDGVIFLSDPATDRLYCRAFLDPNTLIEMNGEKTHPAESLATWLIMNEDFHDHVIVSNDLHRENYWDISIPSADQWQSALAVMLEANEDPLGVMVLLSHEPDAFTENHLNLLVAASNQVAAAINSADLYQLIRDQAERLGKLLRTEQEEAQKNTAILESIADGVMLANSEGKIVLFNTAAERILQLSREQIMGQHITRLAGIYGNTATKWSQMIDEWTASLQPEMQHNTNEFVPERIELGDRVISVELSPVYHTNQFLGTVSVFRDITRDVEVDRIKSQFIENVSHEFRTPLTPIKGYTDLLVMGAGGELSETQSEMIRKIKSNVERLSVLVDDVLEISKLDTMDERLSMQFVDVGELVDDELKRIANLANNVKKNVTHSVELGDSLPSIRADRDRLVQAISNIIDNAFNYTRPGGSIHVRVHHVPDEEAVLVTIADTGVGIPDHFKDSIWRRFERYQEHALELDVAGTGLGLPMAKQVVERHHGKIWFESALDEGTTFFIKLPIEQPNYMTDTLEMLKINTESVGD